MHEAKMLNLLAEPERLRALAADPRILGVAVLVAARSGSETTFTIADKLAAEMRWPRRLIPTARARMLEAGVIEPIGRRTPDGWLYRWAEPAR